MAKNTKNFFHRLQSLIEDAVEAEAKDLTAELEEVRKYVVSGKYMPRGTVTNLAQYLTLSDKEIASLSGDSVGAIVQRRSRYSNALYKVFGEDFFDLAYQSKGVERMRVRRELAVSSVDGKPKAENYIPAELATLGRSVDRYEEFKLQDCEFEVRLIERYSRAGMRRSVERANSAKLQYVISMLEGNSGTPEEQLALRNAIESSAGFTSVDALKGK